MQNSLKTSPTHRGNCCGPKNSGRPILSAVATTVGLLLVGAYRTVGTTYLGGSCRFEPTCSEYAAEALRQHRFMFAIRLILQRLWRCRPAGPFGFDPVPETKGFGT